MHSTDGHDSITANGGSRRPCALSSRRADLAEQLRHIDRHWQEMCREAGGWVSPEAAAEDWICRFAATWRDTHDLPIAGVA